MSPAPSKSKPPVPISFRIERVKDFAVAVTDGTTEEVFDNRFGVMRQRRKWFWLPRSKIEVRSGELKPGTEAVIAVPDWLARHHGLLL